MYSKRDNPKASEVDKAELTLESTKRNLESAQLECRMRERDLERAHEQYDAVCKELKQSEATVSDLQNKIEDLKLQVRHELQKNENIERGLETIPRLKDEIEEQGKKISGLEKELGERSVLLNASRKSAREYKERLRDLERRDEETLCLREELELAKNEVDTLKRLMSGKDVIVMQKCQVLDHAKLSIDKLHTSASSHDEKVRLKKIQHVLDQLKHLHLRSLGDDGLDSSKDKHEPHNRFAQSRPRSAMDHSRGIDVNQHPYARDNGHNKENVDHDRMDDLHGEGQQKSQTYIFLERFLDDIEGTDTRNSGQHRVKTAGQGNPRSGMVRRSASFQHLNGGSRSGGGTGGGGGGGDSSSGLRANKKATSYHHIPRKESSRSPRTHKTGPYSGAHAQAGQHSGTSNIVYTSETSHKLTSKYPPSLEYSLGVSTDDELPTDTMSVKHGSPRDNNNNNNNNNNNSSSSNSNNNHLSNQNVTGSGVANRTRSTHLLSKRGHSTTGSDTESGSHDNGQIADIVGSRPTNQQLLVLSGLSARQKDAILSVVIQNGDRVCISVSQKPPRYGRKKPKPIVYTGIVKYKGVLDTEHYDARVFVGLRLDAPLGESDGTFKGKRYMFTPPDQGKFFKIRDLDSVLDVPSGMYIPTSKLILQHLEECNYPSITNTTTPATNTNGYHQDGNSSNGVSTIPITSGDY